MPSTALSTAPKLAMAGAAADRLSAAMDDHTANPLEAHGVVEYPNTSFKEGNSVTAATAVMEIPANAGPTSVVHLFVPAYLLSSSG